MLPVHASFVKKSTCSYQEAELKRDISGLKRLIASLKCLVADLKRDVSDLLCLVSSLKRLISSLKCLIADLKRDVSGLLCLVSSLKRLKASLICLRKNGEQGVNSRKTAENCSGMSGKGCFGREQTAAAHSLVRTPYPRPANASISMMQITSCNLLMINFENPPAHAAAKEITPRGKDCCSTLPHFSGICNEVCKELCRGNHLHHIRTVA